MNTLLIFFAFPIAVIIISIILQKLLNNPILASAFIFAIFLILTFTAFDETFLIATFAYTALSFITAYITKTACNIISENNIQNVNNTNNINNDCINYNRYRKI